MARGTEGELRRPSPHPRQTARFKTLSSACTQIGTLRGLVQNVRSIVRLRVLYLAPGDRVASSRLATPPLRSGPLGDPTQSLGAMGLHGRKQASGHEWPSLREYGLPRSQSPYLVFAQYVRFCAATNNPKAEGGDLARSRSRKQVFLTTHNPQPGLGHDGRSLSEGRWRA